MRRLTLLMGAGAVVAASAALGVSGRAGIESEESVAFLDTIAYTDGDLRAVRTDGSHQRLLVRDAESPAWSPDGRRVAYMSASRGGIWVVRADGSDPRRLT